MEEAKLICDLMPIFKSEKVDLVNLKKAPPLLMKEIFNSRRVLFCQDKKVYCTYQIYSMKRYAEATSLFELRERAIENFLKKHAQ